MGKIVRRLLVGAWCAALVSAPSAARAQAPDAPRSPSQERLATLFAEFVPRQSVRIVTPDLFLDDATFEAFSGSVIEVQQAGETVPVGLDEIRAVSVRSGHGLQGTLWGTGTGLLVGSVSGMMIAGFYCTSPAACSRDEKNGAVTGGIVMGIAGALAGYYFGRRDRYWRPVFP